MLFRSLNAASAQHLRNSSPIKLVQEKTRYGYKEIFNEDSDRRCFFVTSSSADSQDSERVTRCFVIWAFSCAQIIEQYE